MGYKKQLFTNGETLYAEPLNRMDDQISINADHIAALQDDIASISDNTKPYTHIQSVASATWNVQHNLNRYPVVTVVDSAGSVVIGEVRYLDENTVTIGFSGAFSGKAYLN